MFGVPARTAKLSVVKRFTLECDANTFDGVVKKTGMKTSSNTKIKAVNFPTPPP